jgi:hypothetical protein
MFYGAVPPSEPTNVITLDLNLRSVLTEAIVGAALDNLSANTSFPTHPYFADPMADGARNLTALKTSRVRERLMKLLAAAGHTTRHISMRDLQGFLSYLIFAGGSDLTLSKQEPSLGTRYFNLCFTGDGELFDAIREIFDPVQITVPCIDEALWENEGITDGWIFSRPLLTPDHFDDAWDLFRAVKREYYFEHLDGETLLNYISKSDAVFQQLVNSNASPQDEHLTEVLKAINRFYCQSMQDEQEFLRLWSAQEYDTYTPPVLVSCYRVERSKFALEVPRVAPWLEAALAFKPGHVLLRYKENIQIGLEIDRGLWRALMLAAQGIPLGLRSPQYTQLLQSFTTKLHKVEARPKDLQMTYVLNVSKSRLPYEITVDRSNARYVGR